MTEYCVLWDRQGNRLLAAPTEVAIDDCMGRFLANEPAMSMIRSGLTLAMANDFVRNQRSVLNERERVDA